MKIFKKSLILLGTLIITATSLYASTPQPISDQIATLSLQDPSINSENTKILTIDDLTEFEKKELEDHIAEQEAQGLKLEKVIISTDVNANEGISTYGASNTSLSANGISKHNISEYYTSDTEELSRSSRGMSYWLDVAWNVSIGLTKEWIWIPATILGVAPSNFLSTYHQGDSLKATYTKAYTYTYYRKVDPSINEEMNYYRTTKVLVKGYMDLYTVDKYNKPIRKSNSDSHTVYTDHYFDNAYIIDLVNYNCRTGNSVCQLDFF